MNPAELIVSDDGAGAVIVTAVHDDPLSPTGDHRVEAHRQSYAAAVQGRPMLVDVAIRERARLKAMAWAGGYALRLGNVPIRTVWQAEQRAA